MKKEKWLIPLVDGETCEEEGCRATAAGAAELGLAQAVPPSDR